jgi:primosomal protein N' (replication factor Y)
MFAEVAVNAPLRAGDRTFTFAVPPDIGPRITIGTPVRVPFGRQTATGYVVSLSAGADRAVRPIATVDERMPLLPGELVDLAVWMAEQYVCSVGEALWAMIPSVSAARRKPRVADASGGEEVASPPRPGEPGEVERVLSHVPAARLTVIGDAERFGGYLEALRWLEAGQRGAIFLVPEIVQAQALLVWLNRHSTLPALITHGGLTDAQRWTAWRQIHSGAVRIVVGTRLAVFAPMRNLSLIVIDHEEDASYKEERAPRYHARRVAEERARRAGAAVVWGTPAPSMEIMRAVEEGGAAAVVRPPERRAAVAISDIRAEAGPVGGLFGRRLYQILARILPRGRAMLFVPRRGYADFLLCHECGWVPRCPQCGVAMTYHVRQVRLQCHLCGRSEPAPEICRTCGGTHLRPHGVGTERVEQAARRLFRGTTILRLDAEAAPDEAAQQRVWQQFGRKGGLLIGTQLLVKGVGQVPAAVVGVIGIDAGLNLPDFRAAERTYQVLTRLVALAEQEMIVQTFAPSHPALRALVQQDAETFYRDELAARKRFHYPPYHTLVNLIVIGPDPDAARDVAAHLAGALGDGTEVLGPSPAPLARVRGRYRWQVLVKEIEELAARRALAGLLRTLALPRETKVLVDVDPVDLL